MTELEKARREIDQADEEIARAFERRMRAAAAVAAYKKENGLPVFDPAREQALIERNGALIPDETLRSYYIRMLKTMMTLSKDYQHLLLEDRLRGMRRFRSPAALPALHREESGHNRAGPLLWKQLYPRYRSVHPEILPRLY